MSPQRTGNHCTSTSWPVSLFSSCAVRVNVLPVVTNTRCSQPDSVLTVQDALTSMRVSQSQSTQDGGSGSSDSDLGQQMLIERLPVLHLKRFRFRYDAAAGDVTKICKPVQFPQLDIPNINILYSFFHTRDSQD